MMRKNEKEIDIIACGACGDSHHIVFCDTQLVPYSKLMPLVKTQQNHMFIVIRNGISKRLVKLNIDRIMRALSYRNTSSSQTWLISCGSTPSLNMVSINNCSIIPKISDLQYLMSLVAVMRSLVEEGEISAEKALEDLQEDLKSEIVLLRNATER